MNRKMMMWLVGSFISLATFAQSSAGLRIGDFNKVGDFISLRPQKTFEPDLLKDSPKFTKLRLGEKELVLTYKVTGEGKGSIRYFDPGKNEWIDIFIVDCCAHATKGSLWIYDGKAFKQKSDLLFFYTETYSDSARTNPEKKKLQVARFLVGASFKKYETTLNPKNKFPHKVIVSKWLLREQFGDIEDKYKEYPLEDKTVTTF